jgi:MFS family permease
MIWGLVLSALIDVASVTTFRYDVFLGFRALDGVGWAMFATVGILVFLFPLYLVKRADLGPQTVGVLVGLTVLGRLTALWLAGGVSDRWGRMRALIPGPLIYAVLLVSLSQLTHVVLLGLSSFAIGAVAGFVSVIPTAFTSDRVEPALRGVAVGWLRTMSDTGQILGPLVMGALADAVDLSAPFFVGGALLASTAWPCVRYAKLGAMAVGARGSDS